jgi:hypothetical protein
MEEKADLSIDHFMCLMARFSPSKAGRSSDSSTVLYHLSLRDLQREFPWSERERERERATLPAVTQHERKKKDKQERAREFPWSEKHKQETVRVSLERCK